MVVHHPSDCGLDSRGSKVDQRACCELTRGSLGLGLLRKAESFSVKLGTSSNEPLSGQEFSAIMRGIQATILR